MSRIRSGCIALVLLAAGFVTPAAAFAQDFSCTEIIGYSQTMQWYYGGAQEQLGRGRSQLRWEGGGSIDLWGRSWLRGLVGERSTQRLRAEC